MGKSTWKFVWKAIISAMTTDSGDIDNTTRVMMTEKVVLTLDQNNFSIIYSVFVVDAVCIVEKGTRSSFVFAQHH